MGELVSIYGGDGSFGRRSIDTSHSRRQYAVKKVANNPELKKMMKSLIGGVDEPMPDNGLNVDTYAAMRELARGMDVKELKDPILGNLIISDGLALMHFHALQDMITRDPEGDAWDVNVETTAAWSSPTQQRREVL